MGQLTTLRAQINEFLSHNTLTIKDIEGKKTIRIYSKLLKLFEEVPDTRVQGRTVYKIEELLLMIFLAALAGGDSCTETVLFWQYHSKLYTKLFNHDTIPSHDTFRRILGLVDPKIFNSILVNILLDSDDAIRKALGLKKSPVRHLAADGKALRGTTRIGRNAKRGIQTLNVYDNESGTCLCTEPIEEKSNEIPVAQGIFKEMNLKNTVVTFDALNTQIETIKAIADSNGDYVGGLKGNQMKMNKCAMEIFAEDKLKNFEHTDFHLRTSEIAHNQLEERDFFMFPLTSSHKKGLFSEWKKIHAIVCYKKHTVHNVTGKDNIEIRYYITSLKNLEDIAFCIRAHWEVENGLHWFLDTVMHEDTMTLSDKVASTNRSIINKMCLSLYKRMLELTGKKGTISKKSLRKGFGWDFTKLMTQALTLLDPLTFSRVVTIEQKK